MYLTYEEYQNMGGTLDSTTFNDCEMEAETIVDWYTFNRLKNDTTYPEELKKCMYLLIKYINMQSQLTGIPMGGSNDRLVGGSITSQSNDGVSVSYNVLSAQELKADTDSKIKQIIQSTLQTATNELGKKLLYRGLYPDE